MTEAFDKDIGIKHIAVPRTGEDLLAIGESKKRVTVWSFQARRKVCRLATVLDFGGPRLGLACKGQPIVVAGSWRKGAVAYKDKSAEILWSRPDLKGIQQLPNLPHPISSQSSA